MLRKIGSLLSRFEEAYVKHVFRESNRCADALAKSECKLDKSLQRYPIAPSFIEKFLAEDIGGSYSSMKVFL